MGLGAFFAPICELKESRADGGATEAEAMVHPQF